MKLKLGVFQMLHVPSATKMNFCCVFLVCFEISIATQFIIVLQFHIINSKPHEKLLLPEMQLSPLPVYPDCYMITFYDGESCEDLDMLIMVCESYIYLLTC